MKFIGLVMAFLVVIILGFLFIGFTATQTPPDNTTKAGQQFANLSATTDISFTGYTGVILLLVAAMVMGGVWMIIKAVI